jgi:hypothetical protein
MLKVLKSGSNFKVKITQYGLAIRKTHMKYDSNVTYHSKDMANVKVFEKWVKHQGQGVKNYGTNRKILS